MSFKEAMNSQVKCHKEVKKEQDCQAEVSPAVSDFWKTRSREAMGAQATLSSAGKRNSVDSSSNQPGLWKER